MIINRNNIFNKFKWLKDKNRPFIISADYDGLVCAAFLSPPYAVEVSRIL